VDGRRFYEICQGLQDLSVHLEAVLKMHLTPNGCVAICVKMLTYCVYAPLLNQIDALPLSVIYYF